MTILMECHRGHRLGLERRYMQFAHRPLPPFALTFDVVRLGVSASATRSAPCGNVGPNPTAIPAKQGVDGRFGRFDVPGCAL